MQVRFAAALGWVAALISLGVQAQSVAPVTSGVLTLNSSASIEVTKDVLTVVFTVAREGSDAQTVQSGLKQSLDAALVEARKIAKPATVEVQTDNFSLHPRYAAPVKGAPPVISGWQGTTELIVRGKDIAAIAQLTGRIQTMAIARVGYTLSREAREKVEADVSAQAIARWHAMAAQMSQQFGYSGYVVREVNVSTNDAQPPPMQMRALRAAAVADEALPTEAGKAEVTASVSGSAQMTK